MIGVTQTSFGYPEGNCFMAAVASVIEEPLDTLPDLFEVCCEWDDGVARWKEDGRQWWHVTQAALREAGWYIFCMYPATGVPAGYALAGGASPRATNVDESGKDVGHIVVVHDGVTVHDPHPSGDGLAGDPTEYYVLVRLIEPMLHE